MLKLGKTYSAKVVGLKGDAKRKVVVINLPECPNLPERYFPSFNLENEAGKRYYDSVKDTLVKDAEIKVYFQKSKTDSRIINGMIDTNANWFEEDTEEVEAIFE